MNPSRNRRSLRLPGYDYTRPGAYFVTICTHRREPLFGRIANGQMRRSPFGRVVETYWARIPRRFTYVELDAFVVMPDHIHGVILITNGKGGDAAFTPGEQAVSVTGHGRGSVELCDLGAASPLRDGMGSAPCDGGASPLRDGGRPHGPPPGSLGAIVGNFKSVTTRRINRMRKTPGAPVWQRNYYERIVHDETALQRVREYINDDPARWVG